MNERCRCGAELLADLPMCLACGVRRPEPRVLIGAGGPGPVPGRPVLRPMAAPVAAHHRPAPTPMPTPVPPLMAPVPPVPVPPARSSTPWIVAAAMIVVLAVVGAVAVVLLRPTSSGAPILVSAPAPAPVTVTAAPSTTLVAPSSTSGGTDSLQAAVNASSSSVESLDGMWVPQLSSKRPGTVDNGTTYDASSIYAHYQALAAAHPGALLLWSGDWSTYRESDYWVVISGQGFTTAAGANAWCDAQGFAADDCFAKRLSHTAGSTGSTVPRS